MQHLDDADLDLVAALQLAPRAPLNAVAEVLGSSATTVGRRIQRLQDQRLLRFISTAHWSLLITGNPYVVWIKCEPGATTEVAAAVQQIPEAQSILITSGDADIYCTIYPLPGTDLRGLLTRTLPATPGIASIQSHLVLSMSRHAVSWHLNRLTPEQEAALREHADADPGSPPETLDPLSEAEFAVLRLLVEDGRLTAAQAARELDVSRSTAYRLIQSVLEKGAARPRVEIEPAVLGYPITALLTLDVQPQHVPEVLKSLGAHPSGRFTVMTAGPAAITHHGVFRDEAHLARFTTEDIGALPGINGLNMSTALAVLRRQWIPRENDIHLGQKVHDTLGPN
ncbi:Lrp/AsnC family transcriptional regulator [Saccharopolyspora hirsuta]|uniref:Lrp/AsnC family transcriptional regulator n=1 Tax=Saccharopolyspora hirsuta TaxID=1837 RepID=A0A5M7BI70_SACHI|nr:Lrp/AsnC ligand binding domain-containing protein [Saccharopolyspora hirsuta]KAA5828400.1 Lrp/AsnC family transcriptional regulator [Saccharopolyspora hirsuta]